MKSKTILCDIDGTLLSGISRPSYVYENDQRVLSGVVEKIDEWIGKDHLIILTTARPETMRELTKTQLQKAGITYHQLVMGLRHGPRVVINDRSMSGEDRAIAINLDRNEGFDGIEL